MRLKKKYVSNMAIKKLVAARYTPNSILIYDLL
jgi:hypothetical protein